MKNLILIGILVIIIGLAIAKIVIEKKRGNKCIGCPHGKSSSTGCNCNHNENE